MEQFVVAMKILKQFTLFRFYLAVCMLAISAFTYAEYYGYALMGSDENQRENTNRVHGGRVNSIHHK